MESKKKIGRYDAEELSAGGQGKVYKAHDPVLDVDVIIKELKAPDNQRAREKFEKEVKILREMHSTNIVRTYDFFTEGNSEYIGMEFVDGMDLGKLIEKQKGLPLPLAMHIFRQVCQGLYDAHRKGIIHRDIKPENVLISKNGDVLMADFGIAGTEESFSSEASSTYGSRRFMAPELWGGEKASKKSDIYSMGAMLYNMLFGMPPFDDEDAFSLELKIVQGDYVKPDVLDPDIPPAMNELIVSMLEYERDDRPDIDEVISRVEEYEKSLAGGIRAVLDDALKTSIASDKKLDYHSLKLQNGFVTDLCSPASLYTKSCSVQLSVDVEEGHDGSYLSRSSLRLYAIVFKCEGRELRFQDSIELSNFLKRTEYQSEEHVFEPGEYLVKLDVGFAAYLRSFSLQREQTHHRQTQHISIIVNPSPFVDPIPFNSPDLEPHILDKESGKDITGQAIFEVKDRNDNWVKKQLEGSFDLNLFNAFRPFRVSCEGYESRKLYVPSEIGLCQSITYWDIPLLKKSSETDMKRWDKAFVITGGVLQKYLGSATDVTIPDDVTEIASEAFRGCSSLASVIIPKGVTEIGEKAFQNCNIHEVSHPCLTIRGGLAIKWNSPKDGKLLYCASQLADITVPSGITEICGKAFAGCTSLISVSIPEGVITIGEKAFSDCASLASVSIPSSVKTICGEAFVGCSSLKSISIPDEVITIGEKVFSACVSLTSVSIPNSVKTLCREAFSGCSSLKSVSIPEGVTEIDGGAFKGCTSLNSATIPGHVTEFGSDVFRGCTSLATAIILDGVTEIGDNAFMGCMSLTSVEIPEGVERIGMGAFRECGSLTSVTIPDSVRKIGDVAFSACTSLRSVTIPRGVKKIGGEAFKGCTTLVSVTIPDGLTEIGEGTFSGCTSLVSVTIPEGVTKICKDAFEGCTSLASVTIHDGVREIGGNAFEGCTSLASVNIPGSVTEISWGAFEGCTSLASVTIPDGVTRIDLCVFQDCRSLTSVNIPDSVTRIDSSAFQDCTSLTSVNIPDSVTKICDTAFKNCNISGISHPCLAIHDGLAIKGSMLLYCANHKVTSVTIPDSVTEIGGRAFEDCTSLSSVTIPDNVTKIGEVAFSHCISLTSVIIPDSVTEIGGGAFYDCTSLASVSISEGVEEIDWRVFAGCTSLTSVTIPEGVTEIGKHAFSGCTSLSEIRYGGTDEQWNAVKKDKNWYKNTPAQKVLCSDGIVELPAYGIEDGVLKTWYRAVSEAVILADVTEIGDKAFEGCTSLVSVCIPASVTEIGKRAFEGCTALTEIHYAGTKEQWAAVEKGNDWNKGVPARNVLVRKQ